MRYQLTLFEVPSAKTLVNLYQDRSGSYGNDQWLVWGNLFVLQKKTLALYDQLQQAREKHQYLGELHFTDLPRTWAEPGGKKPKTTYDWLEVCRINFLSDNFYFNVLAVDTHSPQFNYDAFSKPFHAYNRFSRMAITSGIVWFYKGKQELDLSLYFHRQTFEGIGDKEYGIPGTDWDNLATYIYSETSKDVQQRRKSSPNRWPEVKLSEDIKFISADPSEMKSQNFSIHCELIQLTDILTGAVTQAIAAISTRKTKRELASIVGEWMSDIRIEPWKQRLGLHRKFGVSYFPDANGRLYNDGQLKIAKRLPGSRQGKLLK